MADPKWWNEKHNSTWERMKSTMKSDWEQTKVDASKGGTSSRSGQEPMSGKEQDWDRVADSYRYGVGARHQYQDEPSWNERLESKLKEEWNDLRSGRTWDEVKAFVRRGFERGK